jgi:hypothetical protein
VGGLALAAVSSIALGVAPEPAPPLSLGVYPAELSPRVVFARCERERRRVLALPGLPGTPKLDENRVMVFGHAKADPVIFVREPKHEPSDDPIVRRYRRTFQIAPFPWDALRGLAPRFLHHPEHGRAALLREGYLYADEPNLAFALVDLISAQHLFDAQKIWIERGGVTRHAQRTKTGKYVYEDGPEAGRAVRLLLFDRIGTGTPSAPLHRDLRSLRYRLHFDSARVVHATERAMIADLRYGSLWVPSVLRSEGARLELECELAPSERRHELAEHRQVGERKQHVLAKLRHAMVEQIVDGLPFDEPITEFGQQDGHLRYKWLTAYLAGHQTYRMNGDLYYVYGPRGEPRPPQVCVDFVYDTFERASGTWWERLGQDPRRVVGKMDFETFADTTLRRADSMIGLAKSHPERFALHEIPAKERVPMWRKRQFFDYLTAHAERFEPGDIVLIRGYTPFEKAWQRRVMHYHSFFVYEVDPLTGTPIALVGNPGRPSIRTWFFEGLRTPKRSVWYTIRPRLEWLESIMGAEQPEPMAAEPPTLSVEPS